MTAAMKAKDTEKTAALRMVKAAIMVKEKESAKDDAELGDEATLKILQTLVKQRKDSIEQYGKAGREDLIAKEQSELTIIESYLPQSASAEVIEQAVNEAIAEVNAASAKDMGAVMKVVQVKLKGKNPDNKVVSDLVKSRLQ